MLGFSSLCFCFLEELLEKEKAEVSNELLVDWHMVQVLYQVFRYCTVEYTIVHFCRIKLGILTLALASLAASASAAMAL